MSQILELKSLVEGKWLREAFDENKYNKKILHMGNFVTVETQPEVKKALRHTFQKYFDTLTWP